MGGGAHLVSSADDDLMKREGGSHDTLRWRSLQWLCDTVAKWKSVGPWLKKKLTSELTLNGNVYNLYVLADPNGCAGFEGFRVL